MSVWIHHLGINQSINWLFIYVLSHLIKEWTRAGFISSHKFHVDLTILWMRYCEWSGSGSVCHQVSCASTVLSRHIWTSAWNVTKLLTFLLIKRSETGQMGILLDTVFQGSKFMNSWIVELFDSRGNIMKFWVNDVRMCCSQAQGWIHHFWKMFAWRTYVLRTCVSSLASGSSTNQMLDMIRTGHLSQGCPTSSWCVEWHVRWGSRRAWRSQKSVWQQCLECFPRSIEFFILCVNTIGLRQW